VTVKNLFEDHTLTMCFMMFYITYGVYYIHSRVCTNSPIISNPSERTRILATYNLKFIFENFM